MKFGEAFAEYLHGDKELFLEKFSHVEYKKLKKVLKRCRTANGGGSCRLGSREMAERGGECEGEGESSSSPQCCECDSCPFCDEKFFSELMKEASEIAGCFSSRVRRLLHLHISTGMQSCVLQLFHCFRHNQQLKIQQVQMLVEYATMNAIAMRKILKKYDKVHSSVNGKNFQLRMRADHMELLQSPWLIELGAFCINFNGNSEEVSNRFSHQFSCDLSSDQATMRFIVSDSVKLEYTLTCAICLETVFNPYALSCGHLFCKMCICSAASVMIFEGLKAAPAVSKCPVCREVGVYANSVHMAELDLLLKNRCKEYWKERCIAERAEMVKQSKEYWDSQTKSVLGI
ncbi:hypothetical protein Scep_003524 [Stephania cephalantha]|uniref:RING-type E3 ubiquitin transferase n=1 Tax=Stephania cephalantha TaxID=152367 RepID=A0AAP0KRK9_9MAGN